MNQTLDVSVLLIFFNRADTFGRVFDQVRKAKPSRLFLYQDGPRKDRADDIKGIMECRKIAEQIDWPCHVEKLYQQNNYGCDPSEYLAQKWAFSLTDKCIVLEDDDVPSLSFFTFCKEMLDRYENDERIMLISGFNHEEITQDCPYDYIFTSNVSIWGWASWRRVIDQWQPDYPILKDPYNYQKLETYIRSKRLMPSFLKMMKSHEESGKAFYESILISNQWLNHGLSIVPTKNLIKNIGVSADSTHFVGSLNCQPRAIRRIFTMASHEMNFPLKHPPYILEDVNFKNRVYRIMGWGHPFVRFYRLLEQGIYIVFYGQFFHALKMVLGMMKKGRHQ